MACDSCYTRKVRCELEHGRPCMACRKNGSSCTFDVAEASKLRRRFRKQRHSLNNLITGSNRTHDLDLGRSSGPRDDGTENRGIDFTPSNEDPVEDDLLPNKVLALFFRHGLNSTSWSTFEDHGSTRMAYTGTPAANLAAIADIQEPIPTTTNNTSLHIPFPSIRSHLPWKPDAKQSVLNWYTSSMKTDIASLPSKEVLDDLIDAYFTKINPYFPVIDESEFRRQCSSTDDQPPLLLLQAVILAGSHVSSHQKMMNSRSTVGKVIYRRVKALFDMRYENDRMHLIQTALLMAWYSDGGADDVSSNVYYWAGVATRIAFGLGIHRDLSPSNPTAMPDKDRRIYRRLWWTLYQVEILASLQYGRPSMMDPGEIDQPEILQDDFVEQDGKLNDHIDVDFCKWQTSLCTIVYSVTKFFSPGMVLQYTKDPALYKVAKENLDKELASWYSGLPSRLTCQNGVELNGATQLQLHFNIALLHLHRTPQPGIRAAVKDPISADPISADAAISIANAFEGAVLSNSHGQCWFTSVGALLAAGIHFIHAARSAIHAADTILATQALHRLESMLPSAQKLSGYWPVVEAVHGLLSELCKQCKLQLQKLLHYSLPSQSDGFHVIQELRSPEAAVQHVPNILASAERSGNRTAEGPASCEPDFQNHVLSTSDIAITEWLSESLYQLPDSDLFDKC